MAVPRNPAPDATGGAQPPEGAAGSVGAAGSAGVWSSGTVSFTSVKGSVRQRSSGFDKMTGPGADDPVKMTLISPSSN